MRAGNFLSYAPAVDEEKNITGMVCYCFGDLDARNKQYDDYAKENGLQIRIAAAHRIRLDGHDHNRFLEWVDQAAKQEGVSVGRRAVLRVETGKANLGGASLGLALAAGFFAEAVPSCEWDIVLATGDFYWDSEYRDNEHPTVRKYVVSRVDNIDKKMERIVAWLEDPPKGIRQPDDNILILVPKDNVGPQSGSDHIDIDDFNRRLEAIKRENWRGRVVCKAVGSDRDLWQALRTAEGNPDTGRSRFWAVASTVAILLAIAAGGAFFPTGTGSISDEGGRPRGEQPPPCSLCPPMQTLESNAGRITISQRPITVRQLEAAFNDRQFNVILADLMKQVPADDHRALREPGCQNEEQYDDGMDWRNTPNGPRPPDAPAVCVPWTLANAYTLYLTQLTGTAFSLPSGSAWTVVRASIQDRRGKQVDYIDEWLADCATPSGPPCGIRAVGRAIGHPVLHEVSGFARDSRRGFRIMRASGL